MNKDQDITRKPVVIITGGAGLLGREHARALLEIQFQVVLLDVNKKALLDAATVLDREYPNSNVLTIKCDISDEGQVRQSVSTVMESFGTIDVLINNAAINHALRSEKKDEIIAFEKFELGAWERELAVGLGGAFLVTKYVSRVMQANQRGVILNISSDLSVISPDQRLYQDKTGRQLFFKPVTYSVVKAGLIGFTKYLATYLAPFNIRVNALSPGGVEDGQPNEFVDNLVKRIPMGRMAQKNEYRGVVQFLCTDKSSYMTGQNIVVDGGRSVW